MVDRVGAAVVLCLVTGAAALLAAWNVHRRPVAAPVTLARAGLALYWLGFGVLFLRSAALLLVLEAGLDASTVALLVLQLGAVALCASAAGMVVHVGYLLRARDVLTPAAAVWGVRLALLLVATVLDRPSGLVTGGNGPHVV